MRYFASNPYNVYTIGVPSWWKRVALGTVFLGLSMLGSFTTSYLVLWGYPEWNQQRLLDSQCPAWTAGHSVSVMNSSKGK